MKHRTELRRSALRGLAPAGLIAALLLAGCAAPGGGDEREDGDSTAETSVETLRVGFASDPDFTQIANYKWLDELEQSQGITVEQSYFRSSQDSFRALVSGEVDMAFGTLSSGISLVAQGGDPILAIVSDLKAPDYILVATDTLESLDDLEGKRLGISTPGDISDTLTRVVLGREDVAVDTIQFLQIGGTSARMGALVSQQIDAGPAHAADGLAAVQQGGLKNLYSYGNSVSDYLQQVVFVNANWAAEHQEFVQRAVDSFIETVRWAATDKEGYIELAGEYVEGLDPEIASEAYDIFMDIEMFAVDGGVSEDLLNSTVDIEREVGTLTGDIPPLEDWADTSYVENYVAEHGEF